MNWDDDIDVLGQKKTAKQGRRATMAQNSETQDLSLEDDISLLDPPHRTRKTGHWGDEAPKSAKKTSTNLIEQERFHDSRKEDSDDDIPIIPDIDDIQEEMLSLHESASKAMVSVNKATYKELDNEFGSIQKKIPQVGNINLSLLTTHMYPEEAVTDVDEPWSMDDLFDVMLTCNK